MLRKYILLFIAIVLGCVIGWSVMATPAALGLEADFSAYRMADHIRVIASEERSVNHPERRLYVRDYIISVMEGFGLTAEVDYFVSNVVDYAERDVALEGSNILFRLLGNSDTAIMLMAHYDSRGVNWTLDPVTEVHSLGASDAGYGIATMFEIARFWSGRDIENSIYFFFTDLEEVWLLGAKHAVETMDFSNVSLILNLEARGIRGPVYMFETNEADYNVMRFFSEATNHRFSYSVATAIYRIMPNLTDLTPFLDLGFSGMNFAPLNNLMYYHTELDSYENISLTTMQHYVEMIASLVELFVTDSRFSDVNYFQSNRSAVFFPLPFGLFVLYSDTVAIVLSLIMLVLVLALCYHRKLCLLNVLKWALYVVVAILALALLGLLISLVIFLFNTDQRIYMIRIQREMLVILPSIGVALSLFSFFSKRMQKQFNRNEMIVGSMLLLAIINVLMSFTLVGTTFLILVPLVTTFLCYLPTCARLLICVLPIFLSTILFVPIIYSLALAVSISGIAIIIAVSVLITAPFPALLMDNNRRVKYE